MEFFPAAETREVQYAVAIGVVAVLVVMLIRRRPTPATVALFVVGGLLALGAAPLLETGLSILDHAIGNGSTYLPWAEFWRTFLIGVAATALGVACIARAWASSPER